MFFSFSFPFDKPPDSPPVAREKPSKERHKDGTCMLTQVHVFGFFFFLLVHRVLSLCVVL